MNKTVLITGGNSGIGYAIAKAFKDKNYDVFILGRNEEKLKIAALELSAEYIVSDISKLSR